ncbi:MAG: branched-chain amino acid aminotransferase, partial [Alphaproteobacteria bacterium]|nr:branched-chain amino acid aminotransferase [Alphaproteobacteria bacterium]
MPVLPFDQREGYIWMNGQLLPWQDAKLHVLSHGLHYGSCVFEGERAYGGVIYKSREHTERFHNSARLLDFDIPYSVDEIEAAKKLVVAKNGLQSCYVRPVAWRG